MMNILQYRQDAYAIAHSHGFWEEGDKRNKGEMVMLMVCELSEGVEEHRSGHRCLVGKDPRDPVAAFLDGSVLSENPTITHTTLYDESVKGSLEEEMADTVIRVLDYVQGFGIPVIPRDYRKESTGNLAHDMLRIVGYVIQAFHEDESKTTTGKDWGYVLASIEVFCRWYNIDLERHIQWKMKYNANRPYKHGKRY